MAKHLNDKKYSDQDYLSIEIQLNKGSPHAEIARQLGHDPSGIRKKIKRFGAFEIKGGSWKCTRCLNYTNCTMHYMCDELKSQSICAVYETAVKE